MSQDQRNQEMVSMLAVLSTGFRIVGRAFRAFEHVNNQLMEQYTLTDHVFPTQKPTPPVNEIYASFDSLGASISDYELSMREIPDTHWKRSAKRNGRALFVGDEDEEEDWIAANAAEVPAPKRPIEILERGFDMLAKTFDAFESSMSGEQREEPQKGAKEETPPTQCNSVSVALTSRLKKGKRLTPSSSDTAASANGTEKSEGTTARNSGPVAQMNGHRTSDRTSSRDGSTNGISGVGNKAEEKHPAKKKLPIIPNPKSSERMSRLSPPDTSSKGSPARNTKRAKTSNGDNLATEKPRHRDSITPQPITPKSKSSKRSSTFSPTNTSSRQTPVRAIERAKTGIENDLATEKLQHGGKDDPQAAAAANSKKIKPKPDDIDGIDTSKKTSAPKGHVVNGSKSHDGSSTSTKQDDPPVTEYSYSPVRNKSVPDPKMSPKKCRTTFDFSAPKQRFSNISTVMAAASAHRRRDPRDVDSDDPYGQGLYSDRRWRG